MKSFYRFKSHKHSRNVRVQTVNENLIDYCVWPGSRRFTIVYDGQTATLVAAKIRSLQSRRGLFMYPHFYGHLLTFFNVCPKFLLISLWRLSGLICLCFVPKYTKLVHGQSMAKCRWKGPRKKKKNTEKKNQKSILFVLWIAEIGLITAHYLFLGKQIKEFINLISAVWPGWYMSSWICLCWIYQKLNS